MQGMIHYFWIPEDHYLQTICFNISKAMEQAILEFLAYVGERFKGYFNFPHQKRRTHAIKPEPPAPDTGEILRKRQRTGLDKTEDGVDKHRKHERVYSQNGKTDLSPNSICRSCANGL